MHAYVLCACATSVWPHLQRLLCSPCNAYRTQNVAVHNLQRSSRERQVPRHVRVGRVLRSGCAGHTTARPPHLLCRMYCYGL